MNSKIITTVLLVLAFASFIPVVSADSFFIVKQVEEGINTNGNNPEYCGRGDDGWCDVCNSNIFSCSGPGACWTESYSNPGGCYVWQPRNGPNPEIFDPPVTIDTEVDVPENVVGNLVVRTFDYGGGSWEKEEVEVRVNGAFIGTIPDYACNDGEGCSVFGPFDTTFQNVLFNKGKNSVQLKAVERGSSVSIDLYAIQAESFCGDGIIQQGEECDDGNKNNGDGCDSNCRRELARLTVIKEVINDDGGTKTASDFRLFVGNTEVVSGAKNSFNPGFYTVSEIEDPNYASSIRGACDGDGTVTLNLGDDKICVVRNDDKIVCGNGVVQSGEECDDGNQNNSDQCRNNCRFPFCGDNILDAGEQCEDGNGNNNDACRNDCTTPFCGDGIKDSNEQCDDGNTNNSDDCNNNCELPFCGNGIINSGEECDDGNQNNNDNCRNNCELPFCGDGILDINEQCDDGNNNDNDGCNQICKLEKICEAPIDIMLVVDRSGSMNIKDSGSISRLTHAKLAAINFLNAMNFTKDHAALVSFNQFATLNIGLTGNRKSLVNAITTLKASEATNIGDGIKAGKNELLANGREFRFMILLSDGAPNVMTLPNGSQKFCFVDPRSPTSCTAYAEEQALATKLTRIEIFTIGLGVNNFTENLLRNIANVPSNYFFSPTSSQLEAIYADLVKRICNVPFCGDGLVNGNETCDDANNISGDGCSSECEVEGPQCGNSIIEFNEECDDGNQNNNDGCNSNCLIESCGDGIKQNTEQCDDGNENNNDACRNDCTLPECGDGIADVGEECDDGNEDNDDLCSNDCTKTICGDGIIQQPNGFNEFEQCDDGNEIDGDGCSSICEAENGCLNPIDVMLVIDRSGSMNIRDNGSITRLANAKTASNNFINSMNFSKDKAGLASFNQLATLNLGLTNNQGTITNAINALTATGATNIGDGIKVGRTELLANGGLNKFMILLSDGAPNVMTFPNGSQKFCFVDPQSPTDCTIYAEDQADTTKLAGIEIFTIGLGVNNFTENLLKEIATTPSNYFSAPKSNELQAIYTNITTKICEP